MLDYAKLQTKVTSVMSKVKQGVVTLVRETDVLVDSDEPWGDETQTQVSYPLLATVGSVEQRFIDGETILVTDKQVVFAVPDIEPDMTTDHITVDSVKYQIVGLKRIPEAGTAVAYIAFIRV